VAEGGGGEGREGAEARREGECEGRHPAVNFVVQGSDAGAQVQGHAAGAPCPLRHRWVRPRQHQAVVDQALSPGRRIVSSVPVLPLGHGACFATPGPGPSCDPRCKEPGFGSRVGVNGARSSLGSMRPLRHQAAPLYRHPCALRTWQGRPPTQGAAPTAPGLSRGAHCG